MTFFRPEGLCGGERPWDTADYVSKISNEVSCVIWQGSNQRGTKFRRNERTLSSTALYCTQSAVILIHQPPLKSGNVLLLRLGSFTLLYRHLLFLVYNVVLNQRSLACLTLWESKHLLEINLQRFPLTRATGRVFSLCWNLSFRKRQSTVSVMLFSPALTEKVPSSLSLERRLTRIGTLQSDNGDVHENVAKK